jgi:hypothetical protein
MKCGGYEFEASTRFDKLFLGAAVETKREVSGEGTEHIGQRTRLMRITDDYLRRCKIVEKGWRPSAFPVGTRSLSGYET